MVDKAQMIFEMVDRHRRDIVQRRNASKDAVSEMYYEGARAALHEVQAFVELIQKL